MRSGQARRRVRKIGRRGGGVGDGGIVGGMLEVEVEGARVVIVFGLRMRMRMRMRMESRGRGGG